MNLLNLRKKINKTLKIPLNRKIMKLMINLILRKILKMQKVKVRMNQKTRMKQLLKKIEKWT